MSRADQIYADQLFSGNVSFTGGLGLPSGVIGDTQVSSTAGNRIGYAKVVQQRVVGYGQPNTTATSETRFLYQAVAAGTILQFAAGSIAIAAGAATVTVDLKKNGSSVLTAVITLDNSNAARVMEVAAITTATYVAGDWFEFVVVATASGGTIPTGLGISLTVSEAPA